MVLRAYGTTDKGQVRTTNEDVFAIDERTSLCVVADGMGGHNAGEVAARLAVESIVTFVTENLARGLESAGDTWPFGFDLAFSSTGNLLKTAIHIANLHVLRAAGSSDDYVGMGTTVVAALVVGNQLAVGHVGDSRLYVLANGGMRQLTEDDSWMATVLARDPNADAAVLQNHPMRNALTNVVGARPQIEVHVVEQTLAGGERLLLTSDGVHGVLDNEELGRIVSGRIDQAPAALVAAALAHGSRDNCTAVIAEYTS